MYVIYRLVTTNHQWWSWFISSTKEQYFATSYEGSFCYLSFLDAWFKVSVSAADSAGTETDRSRRFGSDSDDTRKTLHRTPKKLWKNHDKS